MIVSLEKCGISSLKLFRCGHSFDNDLAWPGQWKNVSRVRGFPRYKYQPDNKYLGKGKEGFWNYVFKTARAHERYFLEDDKEVSSFAQDLKRIAETTTKEYEAFSVTLADIQEKLASCDTQGADALTRCDYFDNYIADGIVAALTVDDSL